MAKRPVLQTSSTVAVEPIIQLWLLRILMQLGAHTDFVGPQGFSHNDKLAEALGLGDYIDPYPEDFDHKMVLAELRAQHKKVEKKWGKAPPLPVHLQKNITRLVELVGLSSTDCRLLEFAISLCSDHYLNDASDWLGPLPFTKFIRILAVILQLPEADIKASLREDGALERSGLLSVDRDNNALRYKIALSSASFADQMLSADADPVSLLRGIVTIAGPAELELSDYRHLSPSLETLIPYLRHALTTGKPGVNVLLYGVPGTGKTQLSRTLAKALGCELFEVASEDADGDPISGERRLRAFRTGQSFFSKRRALIAFDEAEDAFSDSGNMFSRRPPVQNSKACINRMLEENPVPTLWLSNSIFDMDAAVIRRFDMVFELPVPPESQRLRILQESCGDLLDAGHIARIAKSEILAPAVVTRASTVVRAIQEELGPQSCAAAVERLINNTLKAQGHRQLAQHDPNQLPEIYDPCFIHTDTDLASIATGLANAGGGRLCLYGPPGTGKTAYGRWLAEQLKMPLLLKRASDLLGKHVGESEKNIAEAFAQATQDGALLMIDEVDSFLQDRRGANQNWEVTMVNEMLTQLESFAGVFIASTNLMTGLDQAALRRFDLKVKFDFLRPEQVVALLLRYCTLLNLPEPAPALQMKASRLQRLTPGDFAAVRRQHRFRPIHTPAELLAALEAECAIKEGGKGAIGFV